MRKHLLVVGILLFSLAGTAALKGLPFNKETDERFDALEDANAGGTLASTYLLVGNSSNVATATEVTGDVTIGNTGVTAIGAGKVTEAMLAVPTADGLNAGRVARATFTFADGDLDVGANSLGVTLPAKAIIYRSWIHIKTQIADTGTCTQAIHCEDANNIKTATDLTGTASAGFIEGQSTGAISAAVNGIGSACVITLTVADGGSCVPSAGAGEVYVQYVVGN